MAENRKTPPPMKQRTGETLVFPSVRKNDPEDVSWALSTAEAMWKRGDVVEAVKWIRRAAEAASECDADVRALELAKAAADLSTQLDSGDRPTRIAPTPAMRVSPPPASTPAPVTKRVPPQPSKPPPPPAARENAGRSPATSRVSPSGPVSTKQPGGSNGRPLEPQRRRSRGNLGDEARASKNMRAPLADADATAETHVPIISSEARKRNRSRPAADEVTGTIVTDKLKAPNAGGRSDDPDNWPTQTFSGDDFDIMASEHTQIGTPAYVENAKSFSGAQSPAKMTAVSAKPSQAVRVIVWRDQSGVRVAPIGSSISAISIDAVLVALDPSADLAAWLAKK